MLSSRYTELFKFYWNILNIQNEWMIVCVFLCLLSCVQMLRSALWWKVVLLGTVRTRPCRKQTVEPMIQAAWRLSRPANTERVDQQRALCRRRPQDENWKSHRAWDSQAVSKRAKILQLASHLPSHTHHKVCWKWQVRKRAPFHLTVVPVVFQLHGLLHYPKRWDQVLFWKCIIMHALIRTHTHKHTPAPLLHSSSTSKLPPPHVLMLEIVFLLHDLKYSKYVYQLTCRQESTSAYLLFHHIFISSFLSKTENFFCCSNALAHSKKC